MVNVVIFTGVSGKLFQRAIGAYQLAHFLRQQGYTVQVVDFTDEFSVTELNDVVDQFVGDDTLAIGVSTTFYSQLENKFIAADKTFDAIISPQLETAVKRAKDKFPKLKIVFGGSRSLAGETADYVDCVIHGYGEDKFLSYLKELEGKSPKSFIIGENLNKKIIKTEPLNTVFNIETLDHRFSHYDNILQNEVLPIEISRGCIFKCKFCAYPLNGKKKLDYLRDPEQIKDELLHNYEKFGTKNYFINDDTFNDSTFKLESLHKVITSLPFKIKFTCYLRVDLLYAHKEQIQLLEELGLASPFFGIESLNQKSAQAIGKGMNTSKLKDFLLELHDVHWKGKIPITCSYIVGLPHDTKQTVQETFNWTKNTPLSSIFFGLSLDNKSFYVSDFNRNYRDYGYKITDESSGAWENENFTYAEAINIAENYNKELMYSNDRPSSWFLMTLLNHDISLEKARNLTVKDIDWRSLLRVKKRKIESYKSLLKDSKCLSAQLL